MKTFFPPTSSFSWLALVLGVSWITPSTLAARQSPGPVAIFRVYGNAPGDATGFFSGDDDTRGIQTAIDAAIEFIRSNPRKMAAVLFEPGGTYHVRPQNTPSCPGALIVRDVDASMSRLEIHGNGSLLVQTHSTFEQALRVCRSRNVLVRDLVFDRDPKPFMLGTVSKTGTDFVEVDYLDGLRPEEFESLVNPNTNEPVRKWGWLLDPQVDGRPKEGSSSFYAIASTAHIDTQNDTYRLTLENSSQVQDFEIGDRFTYHYREGGNNVHIRNSSSIEIRNCGSFASGSMFVNASDCDGISVRNCWVEISPGWWRSTNGDGVHITHSQNVLVDGCRFRGLSDDGINITDVRGFELTNNLFENKRRHAILLDADPQGVNYPNSALGRIASNTADHNGGSFLSHQGGDYTTVWVYDNLPSSNNTTRTSRSNVHVRLKSRGAALVAAAEAGPDHTWSAGDPAIALEPGLEADRTWHIQELVTGGALLVHRASRDDQAWLYLGFGDFVGSGTPAVLLPGTGPDTPPSTHWVVEEVGGDTVRLRSRDTGLYLTLIPSPGGASSGDALRLEPNAPTDPFQFWTLERLED